MTYVITETCVDLKDASCVEVCPVNCIYSTDDDRLYLISPDECIDCGACEPECPWQAIYEEPAVPELFHSDIALNAQTGEMPTRFRVREFQEKPTPTPEEVAQNKRKWSLDPAS